MRRTVALAALALAVLAVAPPRAAHAELARGVVVVNVSGEPVPGIPVVVQSTTRPSLFRSVVSAGDGTFVVPDMPPGMYTIRPSLGATAFTAFSSFLVPPGGDEGKFTGPLALPTGMSSGVELRLSTPDSGGGGTPPVPFEGRLDGVVRRAVGRTDVSDDNLFSFDVGWPSEAVAGETVRITPVTPPGAAFDRTTDLTGFATVIGIAPPTIGGPPETFEFDVALVGAGGVPGTPTRLTDVAPGWYGRARFVLPPRLATVSGRVFVEPGAADGDFDPEDQPLPGTTVRMYAGGDVPPVGSPLRTAVTGEDGTYAFPDVVDGLYLLEVDTPAGPERRLRDLSLFRDEQAGLVPVVDFALTPETCPRRPCDGGALHEVVLEGEAFVGDPASLDVVATLWDGCASAARLDEARGTFAGALGGPFAGPSGVVVVESVSVALGIARVRLRLSAVGPVFPGGFFGPVERRVAVSLGRARLSGCVALDCAALASGVLPAPHALGPSGGAPWTVVSTWSYESWRRCATLGPCPTQSAAPEGGVHDLELELPLFGSPPRRGLRTLDVRVRHGSVGIDRARVVYAGNAWSGPLAGEAGVLTVLGVRSADGRVVVAVRLTAPDRPDGNPGALPAGPVLLTARVGGAYGAVELDLRSPPAPGRLRSPTGGWRATVLGWRSAVDAACD